MKIQKPKSKVPTLQLCKVEKEERIKSGSVLFATLKLDFFELFLGKVSLTVVNIA